MVVDKTGTLTFGRPEVQHVIPMEGVLPKEVLEAAATAEIRSEHPLGQAIVTFAKAQGLTIAEPDHFAYTPGRGIAATLANAMLLVGNRALMIDHRVDVPTSLTERLVAASEVYVARNGQLLGAIAVADTVRPEARAAVDALTALGLRTILLTSDTQPVTKSVAENLSIAEYEADLLPEDKHRKVAALVAAGRIVAMLGDGINDAPALTAANVGVAMGSGTDVARESADMVLLGNDLSRFVDTLVIARRTRNIIWFNFCGTIVVDVIGVVLASLGLLNPLAAAFIHVASEMAFILNSARLLPSIDHQRVATHPSVALLEH